MHRWWYHSVMQIVKADGTREAFDPDKLRKSLRRAGAEKTELQAIVEQIEAEMHQGMRTQEIYRHAFSLLRQSAPPVRARYSLRRALFGLGPTGFPFEDFMARLFIKEGYQARTRITLVGKCATHEIDVAAYKEDHSFVAEAKFHARPGIKSDLQVAMYSYARLLDLKEQKICHEDICGVKEFVIVTNTKFTTTAIDYAQCVGLDLLGWDYPVNNNLHDRIQRAKVYPITVLQNISATQAATLISRGCILCSELLENQRLIRHLHLSQRKSEALLQEARELCNPK